MTSSRPLIWQGSLFVASFIVTWLMVAPDRVRLAHAVPAAAAAGHGWLQGRGAAAPDIPTRTRPPVPEPAAAPGEADPTPDFDAAVRDASHAASSEERVQALQTLAEAPGQQGIDSLVAASVQAVDPLERAVALTSLRQRGTEPGAADRARDAFRLAAMDADPLVAVVAQSALEESGP